MMTLHDISSNRWLLFSGLALLCIFLVVFFRRIALLLDDLIYILFGRWGSGVRGPWYEGNFAPIAGDTDPVEVKVVSGQLPKDLEGCLIRNGPNSLYQPRGGFHWFDGDGMLHALRLKGGRAFYSRQLVETDKVACERKWGRSLFPSFDDFRGLGGLLTLWMAILKTWLRITPTPVAGTANTALAYSAQRLLALNEGMLPTTVKLVCEGLARDFRVLSELKGAGWAGAFTAHPKLDPETGELFFFGYGMHNKPHFDYGVLDKSGNLVRKFEVPIPENVMAHDMALTQDYALLFDVPLAFDFEHAIKKGTLPVVAKKRPLRIGVLPRMAHDASEIVWFETEPWVMFHTMCAWQEGHTVFVVMCPLVGHFDLGLPARPGNKPDLERLTTLVALDMSPKSVEAYRAGQKLTARTMHLHGPEYETDFPRIREDFHTKLCKYGYMAATKTAEFERMEIFHGVLKIDLQAAAADMTRAIKAGQAPTPAARGYVRGFVEHGRRTFGGEAVFAPRKGSRGPDDGYLVLYVHDEEKNKSYGAFYDARSMASKPVAVVEIPQRVPYGFHAIWLTEEQVREQVARR